MNGGKILIFDVAARIFSYDPVGSWHSMLEWRWLRYYPTLAYCKDVGYPPMPAKAVVQLKSLLFGDKISVDDEDLEHLQYQSDEESWGVTHITYFVDKP